MAMVTHIAAGSFAIQAVRKPCAVLVEGVGSAITHTRGRATIPLASCDGTFGIDVNFYLLTTITTPTPVADIAPSCWQHLLTLALADPSFGKTGPIDALLGADVGGHIIQEGIVRGSSNEPFAQSTTLGWVIFGPAEINAPLASSIRSLLTVHGDIGNEDERLDLAMARIFEADADNPNTDGDDDVCENLFLATHRRDSGGRYIVQIPFRPDAPTLGNSHPLALRQFHPLERKLTINPELKAKYLAFMQEYTALGHIKDVSDLLHESSQRYLIPHQRIGEDIKWRFPE